MPAAGKRPTLGGMSHGQAPGAFRLVATLAAALGLSTPPGLSHALQIYGQDDRKDVRELDQGPYAELARSTFALFKTKDVVSDGLGNVGLKTKRHGEERQLLDGEKFYDQPAGSYCSGALVGPDLALTAAHCVETAKDCADARFVFGFSIRREGNDPRSVPARDVFSCKTLVASKLDDAGGDWALVRLDRRVEGRKPLDVDLAAGVKKGDAVVAIGHPAGLPTKVAGGADVREVLRRKGFFTASLDTFPGNSGSPVFSAATLEIVGVMSRSNPAFHYRALTQIEVTPDSSGTSETRYIPEVLEQDGGTGSFVTLATEFASALTAARRGGGAAAPRPAGRALERPVLKGESFRHLLDAATPR